MSWKYKYILAFVPLAMPIFSANADSSLSAVEKEKLDRVHNNIRPFEVDDNITFDYYGKSSALFDMKQKVYPKNLNKEKINIPESEVIDYSSVANNYNRSSMAFHNMRDNFNFINYSDLINGKGFHINKGYAYPYFDYNYKKLFYNYASVCYYYKEFSENYYNKVCDGSLTLEDIKKSISEIDKDIIKNKGVDYFILLRKTDMLKEKIAYGIKSNRDPIAIKKLIDESYFEYFEYYKKGIDALKQKEFKRLYDDAKTAHDKFKSEPYKNYRYIIEQTNIDFDNHE